MIAWVSKWIYLIALIAEVLIRVPIRQQQKGQEIKDRRASSNEQIVLGFLWIGIFILPILFIATDWLNFADYQLPNWTYFLGIAILILAVFIFWRAHADLGMNWSPTLEIHREHVLVTKGIYGIIRHPMYASHLLWCIAQALMLHNWLGGAAGLIIFLPFYFLRVPGEEKMMIDLFGDEYREYRKKTGSILPRLLK
jgi:protein-S-isoprenylcysteine O-methyltransferase Ste14